MTAPGSDTAGSIPHGAELLLGLFIMFAAAKIMAELFERLKQPAVVGEILAGVLIGPSVLGLVSPNAITHTLAELGVIFLLFAVGLETKPAAILRVGKPAMIVAVLGVIVPFVAGWGVMRAWGEGQIAALFMGAAMVATSVGITARVLSGMGLLNTPSARIILGAAVIDDILGLLVLAVVASLAAGAVDYTEISTTAALSVGFVALIAFGGAPLVTRIAPAIKRLRFNHAFFGLSICLCLGLAVAAAEIGVAAIIGAFLAGMALAEAAEGEHDLHEQTRGVTEFFVPFFLVNIGMQLNLAVFNNSETVTMALVITALAVASKLVGCGLGVWNQGLRRMVQVGVGMVPRGEVGIVVAQIGLGLAVIDDRLFGIVLFMAVATTLIAPPFIRPAFTGEKSS